MQVDIFTSSEGVDALCSALSDIGHCSVSIVDSADLEKLQEGKYGTWDYIGEDLLRLGNAETTVTLYLPQDEQLDNCISKIRDMLVRLKTSDSARVMGRLEYYVVGIKTEDWENSWRTHYNPIIVGEKLVVCPSWETYEPDEHMMQRKVLRINPGMAFGTGLDETTHLCLEVLDTALEPGQTVLDIGCGSGILAIAAILLGADHALGVDIDEVALENAKENAALNGVSDRIRFMCGNLVDKVTDKYDIICMNIAADIIITLIPKIPEFLNPGGTLILSGIIEDRKQEVLGTLVGAGLSVKECREKNGWVCVIT